MYRNTFIYCDTHRICYHVTVTMYNASMPPSDSSHESSDDDNDQKQVPLIDLSDDDDFKDEHTAVDNSSNIRINPLYNNDDTEV